MDSKPSSNTTFSGISPEKVVVYTIYCHTHIASGRRYVGQTKKTMMQRWHRHVHDATHITDAERGRKHFANAIRKYGKDAFSHQILETCGSIEDANDAEIAWIAGMR